MFFKMKTCNSKPWVSHLCMLAVGIVLPVASYSQQSTSGQTTTLKRESVPSVQAEQDKQAVERYHTREGRLQAKPLDWSSTIGKPKPLPKKPPFKGQPETSKPGLPDPKAKSEGQRLHPEDWPNLKKPGGPQGRLDGQPRLLPVVGTPDVFTQFCENCLVPNTDYPMATI